MIIRVYYKTLDFQSLFRDKMSYGHIVKLGIFRMMFVQERIDCVLFR